MSKCSFPNSSVPNNIYKLLIQLINPSEATVNADPGICVRKKYFFCKTTQCFNIYITIKGKGYLFHRLKGF